MTKFESLWKHKQNICKISKKKKKKEKTSKEGKYMFGCQVPNEEQNRFSI